MNRFMTALTVVILAAAFPASASAGGPLYVTGAVLDASTDLDFEKDFGRRLFKDDDEGWSLGVGFHIGKHLAIEGTYHDLGSAREDSICSDPEVLCAALVAPSSVDSTAVSVSVLPHWPLNEHVSLYGRVGIATWESDVRESFAGTSLRNVDEEELILGAGVRVAVLGPLGAFAEYSRIADTFETVSLGATLGF